MAGENDIVERGSPLLEQNPTGPVASPFSVVSRPSQVKVFSRIQSEPIHVSHAKFPSAVPMIAASLALTSSNCEARPPGPQSLGQLIMHSRVPAIPEGEPYCPLPARALGIPFDDRYPCEDRANGASPSRSDGTECAILAEPCSLHSRFLFSSSPTNDNPNVGSGQDSAGSENSMYGSSISAGGFVTSTRHSGGSWSRWESNRALKNSRHTRGSLKSESAMGIRHSSNGSNLEYGYPHMPTGKGIMGTFQV
mmetsp:Transcript_42212/g.78981  ORF Transcript_42212/g.78981 Transcript_42212/m.78981 type:complete len:251 (-) Transcript_42212:1556-2308(-)